MERDIEPRGYTASGNEVAVMSILKKLEISLYQPLKFLHQKSEKLMHGKNESLQRSTRDMNKKQLLPMITHRRG
jgi:hypothetical protein